MLFVDETSIMKKLQFFKEQLIIIEEIKSIHSKIEAKAVERVASCMLECILDIGNAIIDGFVMRDPGSYEDIIDILVDEKVVTANMEAPLKEVVGLRKMLVREFAYVDINEVVRVLTECLPTLKQFSPAVRDYLTNELGPVSAFLPEASK